MIQTTQKEIERLQILRLAIIALLAAVFAFALASDAVAETISRKNVAAAIPKLEQLAKDSIADARVPGLAIAVVYKDEVVYLGGFGVREAGKPDPVEADTVFQLASLSKPISTPASSFTKPIRPSRSRSAIFLLTVAACLETQEMIWSNSDFRAPKFCTGYAISGRRAASGRAMPTAISASPRERSRPPSQLAWPGRTWPGRNSTNHLAWI